MADDEFAIDKRLEQRKHLQQQQQLEQGAALVADAFPPLWKRLHENLLKEGFDPAQAMELLKTYVLSNGQVRP